MLVNIGLQSFDAVITFFNLEGYCLYFCESLTENRLALFEFSASDTVLDVDVFF